MENKKQSNFILQAAVTIILVIAIIVRFFLKEEDCANWINTLNMVGLLFAWYTLYDELKKDFGESTKFDFLTGILGLVFLAIAIVTCMVAFNAVKMSNLWSDVVLLVTLLISLPIRFLKMLVGLWIK